MIEVIKILRLEDVFYYHDLVITSTGGDPGVRDRGLVESAYYSAFQSFGGVDLFETLEEKASRIGFGLAKNHGFVDGNKRVGCLVLTSFLEMNGITLQCSSESRAGNPRALACWRNAINQITLDSVFSCASFDHFISQDLAFSRFAYTIPSNESQLV